MRGRSGLVPAALAIVVVAAALAASLAGPLVVGAASPSEPPAATPRPLTCTERYPDPGPAGLDLRIPCIVRELMGLVENPGDEPARLTMWLPTIAMLATAGFIAALILGRILGRARVGFERRTAPAAPGLRWSCPRCHSVNEPSRERCYSCGTAWSPAATTMPVAEHPIMVQSFGIDAARSTSAPDGSPADGPDRESTSEDAPPEDARPA